MREFSRKNEEEKNELLFWIYMYYIYESVKMYSKLLIYFIVIKLEPTHVQD